MSSLIYVVTGASRGIGRGLVTSLLQRPNTTVIASVRKLTNEAREDIESIPKASGSQVITVQIDSESEADPQNAVKELQSKHSINHVDIVIANAGIGKHYGPATTTPVVEFKDHFWVNSIAPIILFQAFWPLLERSRTPKFIAITSSLGSISSIGDFPLGVTAYGGSKAALNYMVRKIHFENPKLIAFPLAPGWVSTEAGNLGASTVGMEKAPTSVEDSVKGLLQKIDGATRDQTSGTFQSADGAEYGW